MEDESKKSPVIETALTPLISQATKMLAGMLDIEASEINVIEARSVVWPDAALGCPEPGMSYIQVPKEGALIQLAVGDSIYFYHMGEGRELFLCENPTQVSPPTAPDRSPGGPGDPDI